MEHRHFTLNAKKNYTLDRYEVEKKYIFGANGDDAGHYELDWNNMAKLEAAMKEQYNMDYPIDNFVEFFRTQSMEDFLDFCDDWSIKLIKL